MGSLMSGWNSTVLGDDKKVRLMRNRSLTNEEVDAFWRQRGRPDNNSGQQSSPLGSPRVVSPLPSPGRSDELQQQQDRPFQAARRLDRNWSLPSPLARGAASPPSHGGGQYFAAYSEPSSPAARAVGFLESSAAADSRPSTSCDWWTTSNWAFLNETPHKQDEANMSGRGRAHKAYAVDQFIVARVLTGNA